MTKENLIQYCELQKEIKSLEGRIDKMQKQSDIVADVVQNGYKRRAVVRGYDYHRAYKLEVLKETLKKRYDKALDMQTRIEVWISAIQRSDIRQIFEYRYIDNMNWIQIMHAMKYNHEDTARRKHDRFLEKFL